MLAPSIAHISAVAAGVHTFRVPLDVRFPANPRSFRTPVSQLRSLLRLVKRAPERALHPVRRALARRIIARSRPGAPVLFVCLGNVCRSPYAEVRFRQGNDHPPCTSRGFIGPGRSSPESAIANAAQRGVDLRAHTSRLATADDLVGDPIVLVMNAVQRRKIRALGGREGAVDVVILGDLDPQDIHTREIRDPWGQPDQVFQESFSRIDRIIEELKVLLPRP